MIELLIGGIIFYALFRIFYYLLKIKPEYTDGYLTYTTAGNCTFSVNDSTVLTFDGSTNYWNNQNTTGTATFEIP